MDSKTISSDERVWACLAHASALLFFFGPLLPVIVWFTQREKSRYAAFHALQAMAYQVLFFSVWVAVIPILMACGMGTMIPLLALTAQGSQASNAVPALFPFAIFAVWGILFAGFGLYVVGALIAGAFCLAGRDVRYPLVGLWLANLVGYAPGSGSALDEQKEDHFVAAVGHSTAILLLWGALVPLIVWITQKERSPRLSFQALQAAVYQGLGALAYFIGGGLYLVSGFGLMISLALGNQSNASAPPSPVVLLLLLPVLCFVFIFLLLGPLYQLFAFIASLRVLRGDDYSYPLLGKMLRRRMQPAPGSPTQAVP
jgi:uncharacterized Tic20 family protein